MPVAIIDLMQGNNSLYSFHDKAERKIFWVDFFFVSLPALLRACQCMRRFYDSRAAFPHLANCVKYCLAACIYYIGAIYIYSSEIIYSYLYI